MTGNWELSVILCLACENSGELDDMPSEVIEVVKQYQLSTFAANVGFPFIFDLFFLPIFVDFLLLFFYMFFPKSFHMKTNVIISLACDLKCLICNSQMST